MLVEKLSEGESKTVEYKESVPENSQKYMKTVVAFANGNGGKIVFGVKDKNYEITGIESENIFELMDSITNAVSDSCEPLIIPDITLQTINGKTVIVVEIAAGKQTPYYIKSSGIKKGLPSFNNDESAFKNTTGCSFLFNVSCSDLLCSE